MIWGILAPDAVVSQRRQQNLGLAAAVRHFNDRSVPGLGGMWFPMPILWSVVAVSIAEELGVPALPVGNAVEALMMRQAKEGSADRRVRGARKLQGVEDWTFRNLTRRGTYVVQPIRMAMVQPLVSLGFVQGSRYGTFRINAAGQRMLDLPVVKEWRRLLGAWSRGENPRGLNDVTSSLAPTSALPPEVRKLILARLVGGGDAASLRRRNLATIGAGPSAAQIEANERLSGIDVDHWADLRAGVAFMDLRDSALLVLDRLEQRLLQLRDANEPVLLSTDTASRVAADQLAALYEHARLRGDRINAGAETTSQRFLSEITSLTAPQLVQRLAERDNSVLRMRGDALSLGPAAGLVRNSDTFRDENKPPQDESFAPQLFRLYNLHCVTTELSGKANPGSRDASQAETV
jgi:hypothetical protein